MKFIKRHINEGLFKTPEQMAKQREKEAAMSDEEIVAGVASEIEEKYKSKVVEEIKDLIKRNYNSEVNFVFGINVGKMLKCGYDNIDINIEYNIDFKTKTLTIVPSYCSPKMIYGPWPKECVLVFSYWMSEEIINYTIGSLATWRHDKFNHLSEFAKVNLDKLVNGERKRVLDKNKEKILNDILELDVKVEKIHCLTGENVDIKFDTTTIISPAARRQFKSKVGEIHYTFTSDDIKNFVDAWCEIFSFENNGRVKMKYRKYINEFCSTETYYEIHKPLTEGMFKTPMEMKKIREKEGLFSDEDIIANHVKLEVLPKQIKECIRTFMNIHKFGPLGWYYAGVGGRFEVFPPARFEYINEPNFSWRKDIVDDYIIDVDTKEIEVNVYFGTTNKTANLHKFSFHGDGMIKNFTTLFPGRLSVNGHRELWSETLNECIQSMIAFDLGTSPSGEPHYNFKNDKEREQLQILSQYKFTLNKFHMFTRKNCDIEIEFNEYVPETGYGCIFDVCSFENDGKLAFSKYKQEFGRRVCTQRDMTDAKEKGQLEEYIR